jgi:hypothetical protein
MTACSPLSFNRRFGGTYRLHFQGQRNRFSKPASKQVASRNPDFNKGHRDSRIPIMPNCIMMASRNGPQLNVVSKPCWRSGILQSQSFSLQELWGKMTCRKPTFDPASLEVAICMLLTAPCLRPLGG